MELSEKPITKTVFTDLKLFRAVVNAIAQTSDNEQTKIEAQHLDVYLVDRINQLQKALQEEKASTEQKPRVHKIFKNGRWESV